MVYEFHTTLGHRGLLSLTPIWLLTIPGLAIWLKSGERDLRILAALIVLLTATCLAFYISRDQIDRNYGGVASGLRWMFWFTPLWLLSTACWR